MKMELDDLKLAWQSLDRRLEQQHTLHLRLYREGQVEQVRRELRPLFLGQIIQIIAGALVALFGGSFWTAHSDVGHLMVSGLIVHLYGLLMILTGARTVYLINRIDLAQPVVGIQKSLAELKTFYARNALVVGLPWWFLWITFMLVFFGYLGADLWANAPSFVYSSVAVGIVGSLATLWFYRWSRRPGRPRLTRAVDASINGRSLSTALALLDQIAEFEKE